MLSAKSVAALALRLDAAQRTGEQIDQFSLEFPEMTIEDGYAVQRAWVGSRIDEGARVIGHKIGLTSRAMQRSSNITEPDYGTLLDDMLLEDGATVDEGRFIVPRVEVELAFILGRDLRGPNCTLFEVLDATSYVVPAIEIIDARIRQVDRVTGATRKVFDTISDNAANAGIVLGGSPVPVDEVDLRWVSSLVYKNGVIEDSGVAGAVLGHPAKGVAWLANRLHPHDEYLAAGEIVLAGSFIAPLPAQSGDVFHADYGRLGSVTVSFA